MRSALQPLSKTIDDAEDFMRSAAIGRSESSWVDAIARANGRVSLGAR